MLEYGTDLIEEVRAETEEEIENAIDQTQEEAEDAWETGTGWAEDAAEGVADFLGGDDDDSENDDDDESGGFLGLFVDGADTRTPAHYHGVIAGVSLAFMGLFLTVFLPSLGRSIRHGKKIYALIYLFAGGQLAASIGLFWAGGFGAPRKIAGDAQGLEAIGAIVGMTMNGIGGLVAVIGGVLFIWTVGVALLQAPEIDSGQGK